MKKRIVLVAGPALVLASVGTGSAYAYFTGSGAANGSASTGTLKPVTVAATAGTPNSMLEPGGDADVVLQVTNSNPYDVTLASVTGNGTIAPNSDHVNCTTTGVTFADQNNLSISIAANGTTQVDLPHAASMDSSSSSGCQGATFSIPVTIAVHK